MEFTGGLSLKKNLCSQWKTLNPQTTTKGSCSLWHCHHDIQASCTNSKMRHGTRQFGTPFEAPNELSWPTLNWIANDFSVQLGCGHLQVGVASKFLFFIFLIFSMKESVVVPYKLDIWFYKFGNTITSLNDVLPLHGPWESKCGMTMIQTELPTSHGYIVFPWLTKRSQEGWVMMVLILVVGLI